MADKKTTEPESITLTGKTSGRQLKLKKTIDDKGVVFYEAPLDGQSETAPKSVKAN